MNLDSLLTEQLIEVAKRYWWVFPILLTLKICRLPKVKGWLGEKLVEHGLKKLDGNEYHIFHDLYLPRPDGQGTTQIDHLVVSRFGLFVIETKNYQGWIFGSEKQRQWTQNIYKVKHKFQNPLQQNALHINALIKLLELEKSVFHNLIFFVGDCTLKTELPANVMTRGLVGFIKKHQDDLLDSTQVEHCLCKIEPLATIGNKREVAKQHVKHLKQRQHTAAKTTAAKSPTAIHTFMPKASTQAPEEAVETKPTASTSPPDCPKCSQPMVERVTKQGTHKGRRFWGCSQFPKCRSRMAAQQQQA